ncbi:MAG: cytosine permease [Actinomycetota bacterium]|nr:cytosine permease [Actinomycetota bacterium]
MDERTPNWGISPVPERLRVLGTLDLTLLWGSLGVSLLVVVAGALLVPTLSLPQALLAILVGGVIGNAMLGAAGMIGADARVPAMVVMRAPLGRNGSYLATALNVAQCLGWAIFELIVIATAAAALSDRVFGFEARWAWTLVFGLVTVALALMGPIGVVREFLRRFGVWIVLASLVYLTWWALDGADVAGLWNAPAEGGASLWEGIDLVVALTVTWIPLAADYTRFARDRGGAFVGTAVGYFIPTLWMWSLGAILVLSRGLDDPVTLPAAVAAAGVGSALALLAVTVDEVDEAFANAYSAAVSAQNVLTAVPQRVLVVAAAVAATAGALVLELGSYTAFLYMLGSFFVPLAGVLFADWLVAGARYGEPEIFRAPPFRAGPVAAWLAGFALYQWLFPQGPSWWVELVERASPPDLGIGASLPSFAVAFVLGAAASYAARRARPTSVPA